MAYIRLDSETPMYDGAELNFIAPCSCTGVEGIKVYYPSETDGSIVTALFTLSDSHGNDLTGVGNLFAEGVRLSAIFDTVNSKVFIKNADSNAYLENQFLRKADYNHTHDASGITSGTLPIARGGTGGTTATEAATNLCEYGTWTPKMQWATNTEVPKVTYQSQIGEYVRIGNIVHAWWKLRFKTSSGWTTNGDYLRISGFPHVFTNSNNQGFLSTVIIPSGSSTKSYYVQTYSGYSHVGVQSQDGLALKLTNSNVGDFYFYGHLTYKIN